MEAITREDVLEAVKEALDAQCHYPDEHRQFIDALIRREKVKAERWEAVKTQLLGWGMMAAAGWLGAKVAKAVGLI